MVGKKMIYALTLLLSTFLGAVGQLLFKMGLSSSVFISFAYLLALGVIFYLISTVFYFYVLSKMHLSWAYSFGGLAYIFAGLLALLVLGEVITPLRWAGIGVIAIGTVLIGIS